MSFLKKIFGDPNERYLRKLQPWLEEINQLEPSFESLDNEALKEKTLEFKKRLSLGATLDDLLPEAFALTREAAKRTLKQRHFDVQMLGGMVLHAGKIAEMKTGEGKTLVATLPAYLNALTGEGVHIVTVNDYLAKRDTVWMGQIYHLLGLSVGCITHEQAFLYDPNFLSLQKSSDLEKIDNERDTLGSFKIFPDFLRPVSRKEAYQADVLYGTNNEFGFDYLRDNMVVNPEDIVQRGHAFAIIDEIDSILIDEARTPLIISAPAEESEELYYKFAQLAEKLKENEDYNIDEKMRSATLSESGIHKIEKWLGIKNLYEEGNIKYIHHIEQALKAKCLFKRDRDYVVKDGQVIIIDEFTGRLMPGRRWSEGLHQAIEAKEGVKIQKESQTLATITFQNYFRMYKKLAGMTGTALTEAEEFHKIYNLDVVVIPTNRPMIRKDLPDKIYKTEEAKFRAIVEEVKARYEKGQPVLIGTISIEKNEKLSELLNRVGVPHNVLNAKNHEKEGEIIAQAGKFKAVTLATNMAGRGVDIILGGNPPDPHEAKIVRDLGGLHVIGTERHEARRIDNQLRGRAGRQGDPGSTQFFLSLEDDLLRIFGGDRLKNLMNRLNIPDDLPIENRLVSRSIEAAQNKIEQFNFDIRKHLLDYDDVINKHREAIYRRRRKFLLAENLKPEILKMIENEIEQVVLFHTSSEDISGWNVKEILEVVQTIFPLSLKHQEKINSLLKPGEGKLGVIEIRSEIINYLKELAFETYDAMENYFIRETNDPLIMRKVEKNICLRALDTFWVEHLEAIDYLRRGIGLQGYGQRDPLVEFKKEAYRLFNELNYLIDKEIVYSIYKTGVAKTKATSLLERKNVSILAPSKTMSEKQSGLVVNEGKAQNLSSGSPTSSYPKVGRNDPCPCGSGKKYKKCHGR